MITIELINSISFYLFIILVPLTALIGAIYLYKKRKTETNPKGIPSLPQHLRINQRKPKTPSPPPQYTYPPWMTVPSETGKIENEESAKELPQPTEESPKLSPLEKILLKGVEDGKYEVSLKPASKGDRGSIKFLDGYFSMEVTAKKEAIEEEEEMEEGSEEEMEAG